MYRLMVVFGLFVISAPLAAAPALNIYGGVYSVRMTPSGDAGSGSYGAALRDELGYDDATRNAFYVGLEHPLPLLPNVRLTRSRFDQSPTNRLTPGLHAGGPRPALLMASRLDITSTDLTLYYTPIEGPLKLDLGLNLRRLEVDFALHVTPEGAPRPIQSVAKQASQTYPAFFAASRVNLPLTDTYLTSRILYSRFKDRRLEQGLAGIGWAPLPLLSVQLGYRYEHQKFHSDNFRVNLTTKGPYLGVAFGLF